MLLVCRRIRQEILKRGAGVHIARGTLKNTKKELDVATHIQGVPDLDKSLDLEKFSKRNYSWFSLSSIDTVGAPLFEAFLISKSVILVYFS